MSSITSKLYRITGGGSSGPVNMLMTSSTLLINPEKITHIEHFQKHVVIRFTAPDAQSLNLKYQTETAARREFNNLQLHIDGTLDPRDPQLK